MRHRSRVRRATTSPEPDWNNQTVPLHALHTGERGVVVEMQGGRGLLGRMTSLGFTPGVEVTMVQNFGRGPLIARVRDVRVALGRGEAGRIHVRRRSG